MKLEKDIETIKKLAAENEGENYGFRSFLKSCAFPTRKIDSVVHRLNKEIEPEIDCRECSNCCFEISPIVKQKDIASMAANLEMTEEEFIEKYLEKTETESEYVFNRLPCPFLEDKSCSIYKFRPEGCRSYPHLHKKNFSRRMISVIKNCSVCPIVFNVYEAVKGEVWDMDDFDDFD